MQNLNRVHGEQYHVGSLKQQMDQIGVATTLPARKKKDRHAHHQIVPLANGLDDGAVRGNASLIQQSHVPADVKDTNIKSAPWLAQQQQAPRHQWLGLADSGGHAASAGGYAPAPAIPPMIQAGHVGQAGPQTQSRVNPDQIPSVPVSRDLPADYYKTHVYPTMEQHLPPPALTPFVAMDQGNASPKYARLTLNCLPVSHDQLASTSLPLGLLLQPLARQTDGEQTIPVLDFGATGPPRCRRCRAYVNPFMTFTNGGNRMTCNLCGHMGEVPSEYFAPTDPSGVRVDRMQRPELLTGTCEFLVPEQYWSKSPAPLHVLFLLDASAESVDRGFLKATCDGILTSLFGSSPSVEASSDNDNVAPRFPTGVRFGFMTYNRDIHFYDVSADVGFPQQLVVTDLHEPFAPLSPESLFVDSGTARKNITTLLQNLPGMFSRSSHAELALLPALNAAISALEKHGGKIVCSTATLPQHGPGKLAQREKGQVPNEEGDFVKDLLKTENVMFRKCQADMIRSGIGIDFFLAAPMGGYLDIATVGFVAEKTGGEVYYYPNWSYPRDGARLSKEIEHTVRRGQGYAALMKVRCSNGLQIASYSGNFTQHTFGADLEFGVISEDTGLSVTFAYDGKLDPKLDAHFQSALLYTSANGQRRVRCSNVVASVTPNTRESMRFVDQDAVISVMAKESAAKVGERTLKDIRQALQDKTTEILASYRKNFSGSHPPGQLVLPENLKEFGMYTLGLIKSRALKAGREPSDRRMHEVRLVKGMGPAELSLYLYPRIIALHTLDPAEGFADEHGRLQMPRAVRASFSQIEPGGAYLVDNGQVLLLWLHQQVSPNLLEDLFGPGCNSLQALDANISSIPTLETLLNAQVRNILLHLESPRGSKGLAIQLARQGLDGAEFEFARLLYEDRNGDASSYVDWLVMLHRGVGMELSGKATRSNDDAGSAITNTISSIAGSVPYWS